MRALLLLLATSVTLFAQVGGNYKGTFTGGGASGDITFVLASDGAELKAEVSFGLGGETVKTKIKSAKVDGSKINIVYQFDLQGNMLESAVTGEVSGAILSGEYHTTGRRRWLGG